MHPRTAATLDRLREAEWFRNIGVHDTDAADILSSWGEAVASCSSAEWIGLCQDAVNMYCAKLSEVSSTAYEKWNEVVLDVRPHALSLTREKTAAEIARYRLPKAFLNAVGWDILHACLEAEFAHIYPPGFYASQVYWYTKGHFPCGWRGNFPHGGKLVIY